VTLAECEALAKRVDPKGTVRVLDEGVYGIWAAASVGGTAAFASAEHAEESVALRALHAALTVLAGAAK
jgi:hypothetical protein